MLCKKSEVYNRFCATIPIACWSHVLREAVSVTRYGDAAGGGQAGEQGEQRLCFVLLEILQNATESMFCSMRPHRCLLALCHQSMAAKSKMSVVQSCY